MPRRATHPVIEPNERVGGKLTDAVVVVDEEFRSRQLIVEVLEDFGYRTAPAASIADASRLRAGTPVDLVLVDARTAARDRGARASATALVQSGAALVIMREPLDDAHRDLEIAGVSAYLAKPVGLQPLLSTVHSVLRSRRGTPVRVSTSAPRQDRPRSREVADEFAAHLFELRFHDAREAFERCYFQHHLRAAHRGWRGLSTQIGLERTYLYRKLRQLGIEPATRVAGPWDPSDSSAPA